ncbi:MAG: hypothetical protein MR346_02505 [Clostridium sp.]|nr:hypothetical protein [Clostridium sp.]
MAIPSWISLGTSSGSMNMNVNVATESHLGRINRSGTITGTTANGTTSSCAVTQYASTETLSVDKNNFTSIAVGSTISITGLSNSANLKIVPDSSIISGVTYDLSIGSTLDSSWNGNTDTTVDGDPGASDTYRFTIRVYIPENKSLDQRVHKFYIKNSNESVSSSIITITQDAGVKNYGNIEVVTFSYADNIPAYGGSVSPSLTYRQTWGWNNSTTNGGLHQAGVNPLATTFSEDGTSTFTVNASTGVVEGVNLETVQQAAKTRQIKVVINLNGKTTTSTASVTQSANTYTCIDPTFVEGLNITFDDIPASGGTVSSSTAKWYVNGTKVDITKDVVATHTITYSSLRFIQITNVEGSTTSVPNFAALTLSLSGDVTAASKGVTETPRSQAGTITATVSSPHCEKTKSATFPVYQAANTATYESLELLQIPTTYTFTKEAGSYIFSPALYVNMSYTSGSKVRRVPMDLGLTPTTEYKVVTPVSGFSMSVNNNRMTVFVTENTGTTTRTGFKVSITASVGSPANLSTTVYTTFDQQAAESTFSITPTALYFNASGGSQTITITSNDSWTLT